MQIGLKYRDALEKASKFLHVFNGALKAESRKALTDREVEVLAQFLVVQMTETPLNPELVFCQEMKSKVRFRMKISKAGLNNIISYLAEKEAIYKTERTPSSEGYWKIHNHFIPRDVVTIKFNFDEASQGLQEAAGETA